MSTRHAASWPQLLPNLFVMLLVALVWGLLLFAGHDLVKPDEVGVWAGLLGGWTAMGTLVTGARACRVLHAMRSLRLPGTAAVTAQAVGLNLLWALALPLLLLQLLGGGVDLALTGGALLLGNAVGLLLLALPGVAWGALALSLPLWWRHFPWPGTALATWLCGAVVLALALWLWSRQFHPGRTAGGWMTPTGLALERDLSSLEPLSPPAGFLQRLRSTWPDRPHGHGADPLAEVLGPRLKTLRQLYGAAGRLATLLSFAGLAAGLLYLGVGGFQPWMLLFLVGMAFVPPVLAGEPSLQLRPGSAWRQAGGAELLLLPGLPAGERLLPALCRQIVASRAERIGLFALVVVTAAAWHGAPVVWLLWAVSWSLLMLPVSLLAVLLDFDGAPPWQRRALWVGLPVAGLASSIALYLCKPWPGHGLALAWLALGPLALCWVGRLYRRVQRRGPPF